MYNHIPKIHQHPTIYRPALDAGMQLVLISHGFYQRVCQRIQHSLAGAGTYDEIICKYGYIMDIQKYDVFPNFLFEGVNDGTCKI